MILSGMNLAERFSLDSIVFMMAYVMLFVRVHYRRRLQRFAAVTGLPPLPVEAQIDFSVQETQSRLTLRDRAHRLYAIGEFAAAAELLALETTRKTDKES